MYICIYTYISYLKRKYLKCVPSNKLTNLMSLNIIRKCLKNLLKGFYLPAK